VCIDADIIRRAVELIADLGQREHQAGLRGYARGHADGYSLAEAHMAEAWHAVADPVACGGPSYADLERRRWTVRGERRTCAEFGQPHPADGPDWSGLVLKHRGMVSLGGPAVHWHRPCTAACYAYAPGWYRPSQAADILATLPGIYTEEIARLRALAARESAAA